MKAKKEQKAKDDQQKRQNGIKDDAEEKPLLPSSHQTTAVGFPYKSDKKDSDKSFFSDTDHDASFVGYKADK